MPFKKGPDPRRETRGRKKGAVKGGAQCKAWADMYGFSFLMRVAEGREKFTTTRIDHEGYEREVITAASATLRTEVAQYLIDRAYGRPSQAIAVGDANGEPLTVQVVHYGKEQLK